MLPEVRTQIVLPGQDFLLAVKEIVASCRPAIHIPIANSPALSLYLRAYARGQHVHRTYRQPANPPMGHGSEGS